MSESPSRTVLHGWHEGHGGKMVDFAGWSMPVQYRTGIIAEHLATRRGAGLFDVSHMGRFRVTGPGAESFLLDTLTNNASGLDPRQAQYTFIANETGGAVDDAYLYRLAGDDFLLVVNAGNRAVDREWLGRYLPASGVDLVDESEEIAMLSLQGPAASDVLTRLVDTRELPENKRNRISVAGFEGRDLVVARTGYTGEPVCFELFPESGVAARLWERLVEAGAVPAGLGARDSLRLEAGLPLYGHELGPGPDGRDIPLFANSLARFAVRTSPERDFVGSAALRAQRAEYELILRRELATPPAERRLTHLVQPVAVFDGRRPLRQGYRVVYRGEEAGWITSGTTVPCAVFEGEGIAAAPGDEHAMRPAGLALLRSDLLPRGDAPLRVEVRDGRGNAATAEVVERNAWPVAPFVRPFGGFEPPAEGRRAPVSQAEAMAARLVEQAGSNQRWRRAECVNLIPSENCVSEFVERLCVSDPAGRYNEHNRLRALGANSEEVRYYRGTAFSMEKEEELVAALRTLFGCRDAEVRVISGQMANDTVYDALKQFRNRHRGRRTPRPLRRVLVHDLNKGGHLSAQPGGALRNYVVHDPRTERPAVDHFVPRSDRPHAIDVEATRELIRKGRPDLVVFGRSVIIHAEPVRAIVEFIHTEFGADNPERPLVMYDGAHVLGLLGEHFQDPLAEGADSRHRLDPQDVLRPSTGSDPRQHRPRPRVRGVLAVRQVACIPRTREQPPSRDVARPARRDLRDDPPSPRVPAAGDPQRQGVRHRPRGPWPRDRRRSRGGLHRYPPGPRAGRARLRWRDGGAAGAGQHHHQPAGVPRRRELRRRVGDTPRDPGDDPVRHERDGLRRAGGTPGGHPPRRRVHGSRVAARRGRPVPATLHADALPSVNAGANRSRKMLVLDSRMALVYPPAA